MLSRVHYAAARSRSMPIKGPDLSLLDDVVAPKVLNAMRAASDQLGRLGIRHWLVGGLAVGAYGHPRAERDVVFLVADNAFEEHPGGLVAMKPGVPIEVQGVAIDHLSAKADEAYLRVGLEAAPTSALEPCPIEVLVYLKIKSPRPKDRLDVLELIRSGIDLNACRAYLQLNAPNLLSRLQTAESDAWAGDE
jgi:hypothetical protein